MITNNLGINNNINLTANQTNQKEDPKLLEACQQFESIFINQLLSQMRSTVPSNGLLDDGNSGQDSGQDVYKSMLDQEYSKQMAEAGGIGLAKMLYDQMKLNPPAK